MIEISVKQVVRLAGWVALAALLAACGGADQPRSAASPTEVRQATSAQTAATPSPVSVDQLLSWAELRWPTLFPTGPATAALRHEDRDYALRFYALTGNYLGVATDGGVWGYGPFTGLQLLSFDSIGAYTCLVDPGRCVPPPPPCKTAVSTGFSGDLNATYDTGGDGGGAAADGDGGSAGVGGSEGKVLNARIQVIRLADGAVLGEGLTDGQRGLVTLNWCRSDLPVLLEMSGTAEARYFDEGVGRLVPFPAERRLRALVDRFDENVGISALTEAAYRYAQNNLVVTSVAASAREHRQSLASDTVPVGLSAAQVRQANATVLAEVNRQLTSRLQQPSMKALATPIDETSPTNVLPNNRYGRMAAFSGGAVLIARTYAPLAPAPALSLADELALDLTDGRINGFALDGRAVASAANRTYDVAKLSENWALGEGLLSRRFGSGTTAAVGETNLDRLDFRYVGEQRSVHVAARYTFDKFGALFATTRKMRTDSGTEVDPHFFDLDSPGFLLPPASSVEVLTFNGIPVDARGFSDASTLPSIFAVGTDGTLYGWGDNRCGAFRGRLDGNDFSGSPTQIAGLPPVARVVGIDGAFFALARDGTVYAWGLNRHHVLDPLGAMADGLCRYADADGVTRDWPVVLRPRKVPGLGGVRYLSGGVLQGIALGDDGTSTVFGLSATDRALVDGGATRYDRYPQVVGAAASVVRTEAVSDASVALLRDGKVEVQSLRDTEFRRLPVPGLSGVVDLLTLPALILSQDAQGQLTLSQPPCGGFLSCAIVQRSAASCPARDAQDRSVALPPSVRLGRFEGTLGFIGTDGRLYLLQQPESPGNCSWRQRALQG